MVGTRIDGKGNLIGVGGPYEEFSKANVRKNVCFGSFSTDPASRACQFMFASPRKRTFEAKGMISDFEHLANQGRPFSFAHAASLTLDLLDHSLQPYQERMIDVGGQSSIRSPGITPRPLARAQSRSLRSKSPASLLAFGSNSEMPG
jgi:hypothetical protein